MTPSAALPGWLLTIVLLVGMAGTLLLLTVPEDSLNTALVYKGF